MKNNFIGRWILMPERSKYAQGTPPAKAIYVFQEGEDGGLEVNIAWTDAEGKDFEVSYSMHPDGKRRSYENPEIADELMSEFKGEQQLNSYTYKGGQTIAFASRILDEKGIMKVLQRFYTPNGDSFDNVQYYEKEE